MCGYKFLLVLMGACADCLPLQKRARGRESTVKTITGTRARDDMKETDGKQTIKKEEKYEKVLL